MKWSSEGKFVATGGRDTVIAFSALAQQQELIVFCFTFSMSKFGMLLDRIASRVFFIIQAPSGIWIGTPRKSLRRAA